MSQKMIEIDFNVVKTLIIGMRGAIRQQHWIEAWRWIGKIEEIVDKANDNARADIVN